MFLRKVMALTGPNGTSCSALEKLYGKEARMSAEMRSKSSHSIASVDDENRAKNGTNKPQQASYDVSEVLKKLRLDLYFSFAR